MRRRLLHALLLLVLGTAAALASLEIGLRLAARLGVQIEALAGDCPNTGPSTPLNHRPNVGRAQQRLEPADRYGAVAGMEYEEIYDEHGIKRSALRPQDGAGTRVLFMGDSFMQGYDDANTIPQHAYEWIAQHPTAKRRLIFLNAGYSSYSPLIFTAQAKALLPALRPDYVVVDIDETDLYDDAVRYRELVNRDQAGGVVGVDRSLATLSLARACEAAHDSRVQLWRVAGPLYYRWRIAARERDERQSERLFEVASTPEGEMPPELRAQMEYFSTTLDELFATLKQSVPASHILVVRHPHLWHLEKSGNGQAAWNRVVGGLVAAAAARSGVTFFDAQDELDAQFAGAPQRYYWNRDMHFNFDGMRAYAALVGRELQRTLDAAD
jgi:lysophospholipase L1-like esterase